MDRLNSDKFDPTSDTNYKMDMNLVILEREISFIAKTVLPIRE